MASTIVQKYQTLLDRLYDRTLEKKVQWSVDILDEDVIACAVGKNTIEMSEGFNANHEPIYVVTLRNEAGKEIERFSDDDLVGVAVSNGRFESYYQLLGEIIQIAKRQNSGADLVLDQLISELDDDLPW